MTLNIVQRKMLQMVPLITYTIAFEFKDTCGAYVNLANFAFIYRNQIVGGGACTKVTGWNYPTQVRGYANANTLSGSTNHKSSYEGIVQDVGACQHGLGLYLDIHNGIITLLRFDQFITLPIPPTYTTSICVDAQGELQFDVRTLKTDAASIASYFVLPSDCATTTLDYCSLAYPTGNPCIINP